MQKNGLVVQLQGVHQEHYWTESDTFTFLVLCKRQEHDERFQASLRINQANNVPAEAKGREGSV